MKYIDEFRDPTLARQLVQAIEKTANCDRSYRLMEFCGGHTHTLFRCGIPALLPHNIRLLHGPGCPVCVLPIKRVDAAINLAMTPRTILCSYGDVLKVPGSKGRSLLKCKSEGGNVMMITSPDDCLEIAEKHPQHTVVFFAVGFETTTPPTAAMLQQAERRAIKNLKIHCNHVLTPPAMTGVFEGDEGLADGPTAIDGLIGPGHVSLVTGSDAFTEICQRYQIPIVVAGFEPIDLLKSILMLVEQVNQSKAVVQNQYDRAVKPRGNPIALSLIAKYFDVREQFEWRGFGLLPNSALELKPAYHSFDAEANGSPLAHSASDNKACECPAVLRGQKEPTSCPLFNNPCTPENPLGSCMVSSEGTCAAYYLYQQHVASQNTGQKKHG